ncbi:MAG: TlpA disulfide reductase family protein [Bryobacteraceae bacterium]|nr:TlpA disulfide reductase family protein [Bryobacteraceae bacterium]
MRRLLLAAFSFGLAGAWGASIPRAVPAFKFHLTDGTPVELSKYRGKVCVVEFLFTTCPHCQETSKVMSKLNAELGPKGFQPLGVAFNENAIMLLPDFIRSFGVNYPTGVAPREKVLEFLGHTSTTRLMVPQVAIIDRKGMIRFQSSVEGDENLHGEMSLRQKIQMLLAEGGTAPAAAKKSK